MTWNQSYVNRISSQYRLSKSNIIFEPTSFSYNNLYTNNVPFALERVILNFVRDREGWFTINYDLREVAPSLLDRSNKITKALELLIKENFIISRKIFVWESVRPTIEYKVIQGV